MIPQGFDHGITFERNRRKGKRLRLHMRDTDRVTFCGRVRDCLQEVKADGVELWDNGSHTIATTDRPADVTCGKCITEGADKQ